MFKALIVIVALLAAAGSSAAAEPQLVGKVTASGRGAAAQLAVPSYTRRPVRVYRYTVTTRPAGMVVRVQPSARRTFPRFTTKAPVTRLITCSRACPLSVSAQLWKLGGVASGGRLPAGRITIRAWRLR